MNLAALIFTFLVYGLFLSVYTGGTGGEESEFPTFDPPETNFRTVPNGCGGFLDCTEYLADIVVNFVLGVVYIVLLIVEIIRLFIEMLILAITNAFTGLDGAPVWLNIAVLAFFSIGFSLGIYRAIRKGDTDSG